MTITTEIRPGDLTDERVLRLLSDHLDDMFATSPAESVHALDVSGLSVPEVTFWVIGDADDGLLRVRGESRDKRDQRHAAGCFLHVGILRLRCNCWSR